MIFFFISRLLSAPESAADIDGLLYRKVSELFCPRTYLRKLTANAGVSLHNSAAAASWRKG
jgi:hypothetical protein